MISVVLAEDKQLLRSGLRVLLECAGEIHVVADAADGNRRWLRCAGTSRTSCPSTSVCPGWAASKRFDNGGRIRPPGGHAD